MRYKFVALFLITESEIGPPLPTDDAVNFAYLYRTLVCCVVTVVRCKHFYVSACVKNSFLYSENMRVYLRLILLIGVILAGVWNNVHNLTVN